ncbi:MAG: SpoIID/LytB domain-containing protein [Candidatus Hydrothermia bacterium]
MEMGNVTFDEYRIEDENIKYVKTSSDTGYFSGDIILKNTGSYIFLQNAVDEEDYVASCVQSLVEKDDTLKEHIKAVAVIVRTFVYNLLKSGIYILPDSLPQWHYRGYGNISDVVKNAVKETKGEILTYLGYPVFTSLTYCTGGFTVPYEEIFFDSLDYSVAVEDTFSLDCPYYQWETKIDKKLVCYKLNLKTIDSVKVLNKTIHLIPDTVAFYGDKEVKIRGIVLYQTFHPALLSPLFDLTVNGDSIYFKGHGKGILVGLPLWSSRKMAKSGKNYREILQYFYPATDILKVETSR